jgi:ligand-binding sensor domain-containing protein
VNTGLTHTAVNALAVDPAAPSTLYVGTWGGPLFKSANGGRSWEAAKAGLTGTNFAALVIDPSAPATLYAGTFHGVFKSTNRGESWEAVSTGLPKIILK